MIGSEKTETIKLNSEQKKNREENKPKIIYNLEDSIIQQVAIDKNLVLRVIENANGKFIDIRRYYKEYPTKKGVRFSYGMFKKLKEILD